MKKHPKKYIIRSFLAFCTGFSYLSLCMFLLLFIYDQVLRISPTKSGSLFAVSEIVFLFLLAVAVSVLSKKLSKHETSHLEMLASKPRKNNYHWPGGYSIFTTVILWMVMVLRSISILQFCKLIYREVRTDDTDYASWRPNVSPSFQEIYYLIWSVFLIGQVSIGLNGTFYYALDIYFLIETVTWILYYAVFRRFFEEKYSIYHVMEHLPVILVLIPLQAIAYASVCTFSGLGITWNTIIPVLLGQASEHFILFSFLGFLYSAIVIGMIIGSFPPEKIKTGNPDTIIVGAGDVVQKRLVPALMKRMEQTEVYKVGEVHIYTREKIDSIHEAWNIHGKFSKCIPGKTESIYSLIKRNFKEKNWVAWIETPSDTHLYYLELLQEKIEFIALEKPMVSGISDLNQMKQIISSEYRKHIFFLSYYILEKALVLTFLKRPNSFYLKYLEGDVEDYYQQYLEIGQLKSINIELTEGSDNRVLPSGGQLIETFIHHCLVASLFTGLPTTWTIKKYENIDNGTQLSIILSATGEHNEIIDLQLNKGRTEKKQVAELLFSNGKIIADFDTREATITNYNSGKTIRINVPRQYSGPYDVQCNMVYRCYENNIDPSSIDGLYHQIEVLEWLINLDKKKSV